MDDIVKEDIVNRLEKARDDIYNDNFGDVQVNMAIISLMLSQELDRIIKGSNYQSKEMSNAEKQYEAGDHRKSRR